jgi:flagellar assembly factor FliW
VTTTTTALTAAGLVGAEGERTVIDFPEGLPGLGDAHSWELVSVKESRPLLWLRSLDRPPLALMVLDPRLVAEGYAPNVPKAQLFRIGYERDHSLLILVVATIPERGQPTVNLRAPVVIDVNTMRGIQAILDDEELPIRFALRSQQSDDRTGRSERCSSSVEKQVNQS